MIVKEEAEDIRIVEVFSLKHEDTEEQTDVCRNPSRLVHCLICHEPQTNIEHHLRNRCLRDAEDGCIQEEVSRAKEAQEKWTREGRIMNLSAVRKLVGEDPSCDSLAEYFQAKGFLIKEEHDSAAIQESEILALTEEDMGEVSSRLRQHKGVPAKTKTVFRSFCLATMMWVHHLGPTSIKEFKLPPASRVQRAMAKETAWTSNVPSVDSVLLAWVPCQEPSPVANHPLLIASVVHQKWKGLAIKHFEGKGKGVIATMKFQKNQVVCDYHGEEVSEQEGERRLETLAGEPSYLFFFRGKGGEPLCIDAQKFPCDCHPDKETFGRRMNHSRRRNNVWPQRVSLNCPEGPRECVLFCALRDIAVSEELLWDYCVCRASVRGKGRGLPWLDD